MDRQWHDLSRTEGLSGLYLKAARKRKITGDSLPEVCNPANCRGSINVLLGSKSVH